MTTKLEGHTPGPWIVDSDSLIGRESPNYPGVIGFAVARALYEEDDSPVEANARLISAAPELLAACEAAYGWATGEDADGIDVLAEVIAPMLHAAIAKAKGNAS